MIANRHPEWLAAMALALGALVLPAGPAAAQGVCTMENLSGTYAYEFHGSGTKVLGSSGQYWSLESRPVYSVGWITLHADGTMDGSGWSIVGATTSLNPTAMAGGLVDLDAAACTAELRWSPVLPGGVLGPLHRERLLFAKNGQEYRSVLIKPPTAGTIWSGRGQRIAQAPGGVQTCGTHLLKGDVLVRTETLRRPEVPPPSQPSFAGAASMLRLTVAEDGSYTGTLYTIDPTSRTVQVYGAFDVQPDCTFGVTLTSVDLPDVTQHGRGVLFGQGKQGFLMLPLETTQLNVPVGVKPVFAWGELLSLGR